jgi:hypothetical protein
LKNAGCPTQAAAELLPGCSGTDLTIASDLSLHLLDYFLHIHGFVIHDPFGTGRDLEDAEHLP